MNNFNSKGHDKDLTFENTNFSFAIITDARSSTGKLFLELQIGKLDKPNLKPDEIGLHERKYPQQAANFRGVLILEEQGKSVLHFHVNLLDLSVVPNKDLDEFSAGQLKFILKEAMNSDMGSAAHTNTRPLHHYQSTGWMSDSNG